MNQIQLDKLADQLLLKMRKRPGHEYNLSRLVKSLDTDESAITVAASNLKKLGYNIKYKAGESIAFIAAPDRLYKEEITHNLRTAFVGQKTYAYQTVQSTNTIAHQLAISNTKEGTLVVAERQTKGRGRMGRSWYSPEGLGIYMSIVLYPKIDPLHSPGISLMTSLVLAESIESFGMPEVSIKWPNDVLIKGKKTAGILTEISAEIGHTNYLIVGVGINVNHRRKDIPGELKSKATSLKLAGGKTFSRIALLQIFLRRMEKAYLRYQKCGLSAIRRKILSYSSLIGKNVEAKLGNEIIAGIAVDIDSLGRLVIESSKGNIHLSAGEVSFH